jgi:hypothetical protein
MNLTQQNPISKMTAPTRRITYIGGPTCLLEFGGVRLLTDPTFDPAALQPCFHRVATNVVESTSVVLFPASSEFSMKPEMWRRRWISDSRQSLILQSF